jgi:hypothetical protein
MILGWNFEIILLYMNSGGGGGEWLFHANVVRVLEYGVSKSVLGWMD